MFILVFSSTSTCRITTTKPNILRKTIIMPAAGIPVSTNMVESAVIKAVSRMTIIPFQSACRIAILTLFQPLSRIALDRRLALDQAALVLSVVVCP